MELENFRRILNELKINLGNSYTKKTVQKADDAFPYEDLVKSIEQYIVNFKVLLDSGEEIVSDIEKKSAELLQLTNDERIQLHIKKFTNLGHFLIEHTPNASSSQKNTIKIDKEEFSRRYDQLVQQLNPLGTPNSNLTLKTKVDKAPFQLFRNTNSSISVLSGEAKTPMSVAKEKLLRVVFENENYTYPSYEQVIIEKILDNSIFDLINNDISQSINWLSDRDIASIQMIAETEKNPFTTTILNGETVFVEHFFGENPADALLEAQKRMGADAQVITAKKIQQIDDESNGLYEVVVAGKKSTGSRNSNSYIEQRIKLLEESIKSLQATDSQIQLREKLVQAEKLFEDATTSKEKVEEKVGLLIQAAEKHISYTLSDQFEKKCQSLADETSKRLGDKFLYIWKFDGFLGAIKIILLVNIVSWLLYLVGSPISSLNFWHFMLLKLTLNIPLLIYLGFSMNEYTKSKKLYEEYEHKRIMAATLINNLKRLKIELQTDEKSLLELIKTPLEKIFDNPVHAIFGDKSTDNESMENIINKFEKISSIITKFKDK